MEIGTAILMIREEKGMTQPDLALASGIAQANLSNIERGKREPSLSTLKRIASGLKVRLSELVLATESDHPTFQLSRERIEGLAAAVLGHRAPPAEFSTELVHAMRSVFLLNNRVSDKALSKDWMFIKKTFSAKDIGEIHKRIEDEKLRQA
jgi:transcriptional regulator with XRE-family HTH domain